MSNVTRNKENRCVRAKVLRSGDDRIRYFTLKQHGTWEAAEEAAEKWVQAQLKELPKLQSSKDRKTTRNTSGVVGVHLHHQVVRKPNGNEYEYYSWVAKWPGCKFRGGVKWPVTTFGDDEAFALAVLCRRMEVETRYRILEALDEIRDTPEHKNILKLRT